MATIENIVYEMLTENTGTHFLDSGGEDGRHWQRNQKKSLADFQAETELELLDADSDYPNYYKSLFHHLVNSLEYLDQDTQDLQAWIDANPYHYLDNKDGRGHIIADIEDYMRMTYNQDLEPRCTYTFNFDNSLSQDIQFISLGDTYECNIIALCIHNGADARGGMTDYKIFKMDDEDLFLGDLYIEYVEGEEARA